MITFTIGELSDDYTGESEEDEDEERSVNTDTGLPDSQLSDGKYDDAREKKKRKKKRKKAAKKEIRKAKRKEEKNTKWKGPPRPLSLSY